MKRLLLSVIFALIFLTGSLHETSAQEPEKKGFGISIAPSVIRLSGKGGEAQATNVRVLNNGASVTRVATEVSDVGNTLQKDGKLSRQFFPAGTLPFSCAKWTLLQENEFTLNPEEFKDVGVVVSPPADSTGGSACVVFFKGAPVTESPKETGGQQAKATIQIQPRLGAMLFYEIEGTIKRTGRLLDLKYEWSETGTLKIQYSFKNEGNADILIAGTFYILDANKTLVTKGNLKPIRTFPGDEGSAETEWTGSLGSGNYEMVVSFELGPGTQEVIVKEIQLSIP